MRLPADPSTTTAAPLVAPWRDRLPRLAPATAMLIIVALQFWPVLAGQVYRFEDIAGYFHPIWTAVVRHLRAGELPLWDRGAWGGQPLIGDPQAGIFYLPNWLCLVVEPLRAYALLTLAHALFAALGMYLLLRYRRASRLAAATGGLALGAGSFVIMQVRHLHFVEATAWLPWLLLAGVRLVDGPSRRRIALAAVAGAMLLLTGGVSMIYYGLWLVAVVLGARIVAAPRPSRWPAVIALGGAAGLALLLAAPMLLPVLAHARLSPRALGADYAFASSFAWSHYGYVVTLFLPRIFGDAAAGSWKGGGTQWELAGYYAGLLPFAAAVYWIVRGERRQRGERIALALLGLLAIGLARQGSLLHRAAYQVLPLLSSTRCPARALYVFTFAVPLLGAAGIDGLRRRLDGRLGRRLAWAAFALVALDLSLTHRLWNPGQPLAAAEAAARPAVLAQLVAHPGDRFVNDVHADHALHNAGLLWDLENASGYHPLPLWRYLHYLWITNHGAPYPGPRIADDLSAQGIWRFASPLVDGLAVRWVLTRQPPAAPGYVKRGRGSDGLELWENLEALPKAWVMPRARVVAGEAAAAAVIAEPGFDPRRDVVLEEAPAVAPQGLEVTPVLAYHQPSSRETLVEAQVALPGILVVAEPYSPEVRVTVDGAPAKLLAANLALRAVALPAGRHSVRFTVENRAARHGLWLGGGGLLLTLGLLLRRRGPVDRRG